MSFLALRRLGALACLALLVPSFVLAASNKETLLTKIATLSTSIDTASNDVQKRLLDIATTLSTAYDKKLVAAGIDPKDVDILVQSKKLSVPAFRQDVSTEYRRLSETLFADLNTTKTTLTAMKGEISLGYSEVSDGQRAVYEQTLSGAQNVYETFASGARAQASTFESGYTARIDTAVANTVQFIKNNDAFLTSIRAMSSEYAQLETNITTLKTLSNTINTSILPKLQNNISVLGSARDNYTQRLRDNLTAGVNKALQNERVARRETDLKLFLERQIQSWTDYLSANFKDDQDLLLATLKTQNILATEAAIRNRLYDGSGSMRLAELAAAGDSGSGSVAQLRADLATLARDVQASVDAEQTVVNRYASGASVVATNDATSLEQAFNQRLPLYQQALADFIVSLSAEASMVDQNTSLQNQASVLANKNRDAVLKIFTLEEDILKNNLKTSVSTDYAEKRVNEFIDTLSTLAEGQTDDTVRTKLMQLRFKYLGVVSEKYLADKRFNPYRRLRRSLETQLKPVLTAVEARGKDTAENQYNVVYTKLATMIATPNIDAKREYLLRVVQRNVYSGLERLYTVKATK